MSRQVGSRDALESRLPNLLKGPHKTESSALHRITYSGPLSQWTSFRADVQANMHANWSRTVVDLNLITRDIKQEEVYVADEVGLQGRFEQAIGQGYRSCLWGTSK
jgi:hypothetical protein